jgi:DNA-binding protein
MDEKTGFMGSKPLMNYVLAIAAQFNAQNTDQVAAKARGRATTSAVHVVKAGRICFAPLSQRSGLGCVPLDRVAAKTPGGWGGYGG